MSSPYSTVATRSLKRGEWLFHEGDLGDCAYLVEEGEILIALEREGEQIPLGLYAEGSLFGEIAIIGDQPRAASAIAQTDCVLRIISRELLNSRLEHADPILKMCMSVIIGHLQRSLDPYREPPEREENLTLDERLQRAADDAVRATALGDLKEILQDAAPAARSVTRAEPISTHLFKQAIKTINIESELRGVVDEEQLVLFYQPIIEARTGKLAGFESLMRWVHPERGLIPPGDFIPIAERSGLISELTRWAIERACYDLVILRDKMLASVELAEHVSEQLFVSVNFSSHDFLNKALMSHVDEVILRSALPRDCLKIEITESVLMNSPAEVESAMSHCREQGASIAIDDFGTGYSSLSYLQNFPADTLKIDQGFIRPMHSNERHLALVESIIHLAQRLDMKTIAEGVETQADADTLSLLQCDYLQGYYFGRPMPLKEVLEWALQQWGAEEVVFLG